MSLRKSCRWSRRAAICTQVVAAVAVLVVSAVLPAMAIAGLNVNDDCNNATSIAGAGTFAFDNSNATLDGTGNVACMSFGTDNIENDIWYCWTADCNDLVTINTCSQTGVDTRIAVYEGCGCPEGTGILACNDDSCGLQSSVTFNAFAGNQYLIRIGTFPGSAGGTGTFSIFCGDPCADVNCPDPVDACFRSECIDGQCIEVPAVICETNNECEFAECIDGECVFTDFCDDGDPCTIDECVLDQPVGLSKDPNDCVHFPIDCDDGDPCTINECVDGICTTQPVDCDDGDPCTFDSCEPAILPGLGAGEPDPNNVEYICINEPIHCIQPQDLCNPVMCVEGDCIPIPVDCDDGDPCTEDFCEVEGEGFEGEAVCRNEPIDCDDDNPCTTEECVNGDCIITPIDCDDGDECTIDDCFAGECINTPIEDCGVPQSQPQSQPSADCGAGLCGFGTLGLMPFMLAGLGLMRWQVTSRRRRG